MIYTKTGDNGTTSLVDGTRVSKCDIRVESYGTVDELNSHIGLLAEMVLEIPQRRNGLDIKEFQRWFGELKKIQNELFVVQTLLATADPEVYQKMPQLPQESVDRLESSIDELTAILPKSNAFVIAGGSKAGAECHVARTVCRRAERQIVRLAETAEVEEVVRKYVNRLSDFLFVLSRHLVLLEEKKENFWHAI